MRPDEQVVLITGGTGGLGRVVTAAFLDAGYTVITTYIDGEEYDAVSESLDDELEGYKIDVTAADQVESLIERVLEDHGRIDVLVNLVGGYAGGHTIEEVDESTWDHMFELNLKSAFLMTKYVLPVMQDHGYGRIVNIASKTGEDLPAMAGPYGIAKRGVASLTEVIAKETRDMNITANAIAPSIINTPENRERLDTSKVHQWVQPEDIAEKIRSIVSDTETSGEIIHMYGGKN